MRLPEACALLCLVHTRDDAETGFHVPVGAGPHPVIVSDTDYIEVWRTLRKAVGLRTEPKETQT